MKMKKAMLVLVPLLAFSLVACARPSPTVRPAPGERRKGACGSPIGPGSRRGRRASSINSIILVPRTIVTKACEDALPGRM